MEWPLVGINWSAIWNQPQISPVKSASVRRSLWAISSLDANRTMR
jgi:hypothetical protein